MSYDIQSLIVHGLMLCAMIWLARALWQTFASKQPGGCGGCSSGGCASKSSSSNATAEPASAPQVFSLSRPK